MAVGTHTRLGVVQAVQDRHEALVCVLLLVPGKVGRVLPHGHQEAVRVKRRRLARVALCVQLVRRCPTLLPSWRGGWVGGGTCLADEGSELAGQAGRVCRRRARAWAMLVGEVVSTHERVVHQRLQDAVHKARCT
jgi:hypothetical protein